MKKFAAAALLVIVAIGMAALVYIESAPTPGERAARMRGCLFCHTDAFAEKPLTCLPQWKRGTPLAPLVEQRLLQAHPTRPGDDAATLAQYIAAQQLPLLAQSRQGERGAALYAAKCAACHGNNGEGQAGMYPPLRGSEWLTPAPNRPTVESIILNGLQGPITVKGEAWNSTMLPPGISAPADVKAISDHVQQFR